MKSFAAFERLSPEERARAVKAAKAKVYRERYIAKRGPTPRMLEQWQSFWAKCKAFDKECAALGIPRPRDERRGSLAMLARAKKHYSAH